MNTYPGNLFLDCAAALDVTPADKQAIQAGVDVLRTHKCEMRSTGRTQWIATAPGQGYGQTIYQCRLCGALQ